MQTQRIDIAIFGGGIAGLWALARLRQLGYQAILFESTKIGGVQSIASQGIIHGGSKYALAGKLTGAAQTIGAMPAIWQAALNGSGEVDLSAAKVWSNNQLLWTNGSVASGMAGFFAGKVMQSRMKTLQPAEYPPLFQDKNFRGSLYQLSEPVLDTASVMCALYDQLKEWCFSFDLTSKNYLQNNTFQISEGCAIQANHVALTAGAGNAALLNIMGKVVPKMQTRPLQMLMLKGQLPPLYAHCLGASANPRLTVTSSQSVDGDTVWYLGGEVAEKGVGLTQQEQVAAGKAELSLLLPWVDVDAAKWSSLNIDRAEPEMPGGKRPDDCYIHSQANIHTCWPTKLAFAPRLAKLLIQQMDETNKPSNQESLAIDLPSPELADLPWNEDREWI